MPDATYYQNQVRLDVGDVGQSAEQEIVFPVEATGGTWDYSFAGATASGLAYPNTAAVVQAALESVLTVGAGNIVVLLGQRGFILQYQGELANQPLPLPTVNGTNLVLTSGSAVSVPVRENQAGKANHWTDARLAEMWERREGIADYELRFLYVKLDAIQELKGIVWTQIDQQTGDARRDYEKQFGHLVQMENATKAALDELAYGEESEVLAQSLQSYRGTPAVRTRTQARFDAKFKRVESCP